MTLISSFARRYVRRGINLLATYLLRVFRFSGKLLLKGVHGALIRLFPEGQLNCEGMLFFSWKVPFHDEPDKRMSTSEAIVETGTTDEEPTPVTPEVEPDPPGGN